MTIQQLEYIIALSKTKHFVQAAEVCGVTQPTLSMMIQKLEEELDVKIFDRSKHPLTVTKIGEEILEQAIITLSQFNRIYEIVYSEKGKIDGDINLAIIPTVAPYVLPKFFKEVRGVYPELKCKISELQTTEIEKKLMMGELDMAILSTPLENTNILEIPLYYEKFVAYISPNDPLYQQKELQSSNLPVENLWVLEEGHCFRSQAFKFCLKDAVRYNSYEAGSIETLIKIVDENGGYTIIPELHIDLLTENQKKNMRSIVSPEPVREISLVIHRNFIREGQLNAIANTIKKIIPNHMLDSRLKKFSIKI